VAKDLALLSNCLLGRSPD